MMKYGRSSKCFFVFQLCMECPDCQSTVECIMLSSVGSVNEKSWNVAQRRKMKGAVFGSNGKSIGEP